MFKFDRLLWIEIVVGAVGAERQEEDWAKSLARGLALCKSLVSGSSEISAFPVELASIHRCYYIRVRVIQQMLSMVWLASGLRLSQPRRWVTHARLGPGESRP